GRADAPGDAGRPGAAPWPHRLSTAGPADARNAPRGEARRAGALRVAGRRAGQRRGAAHAYCLSAPGDRQAVRARTRPHHPRCRLPRHRPAVTTARHLSLRARIIVSYVLFGALLSVVFAAGVYIAFDALEDEFVEETVRSELDQVLS